MAFFVTVGTLLLHGLTLSWVIRRLGVEGRESHDDALAETDAIHAATQAALARLEAVSDGAPESVTTRLRRAAEHRSHSVWERLGRPETEFGEAPSVVYHRLRLEMLAAERPRAIRSRMAVQSRLWGAIRSRMAVLRRAEGDRLVSAGAYPDG